MRCRGWWIVMVGLACGPGPAGSDETTAQGSTGHIPSTDPTDGPADETSAGVSTTDGSTSGSSSDGTTEVFNPNDCGEFLMPFVISPASVVFVVDKSGSMQSLWDHDNDDPDDDGIKQDMSPATPKQPRWRSVHEGLALMAQTYDQALNSGLSLVPSKAATADQSAAACPVEGLLDVPVEPMNAAAVIAALPAADDLSFAGATPTTRGIAAAVAGLEDVESGPRSIVLLTDGAANCQAGAQGPMELLESYDDQLPVAVAEAYAQGIPTHVLGVDIVNEVSGVAQDSEPDGVNAYDLLNEVAIAGGAPQPFNSKFHVVVNETLLAQAFERVASRILDCTAVFDEPAAYADYVEIYIDDENWGRPWDGDCAGEDGWFYTNEEKTAVQLCGAMCAAFGRAGEIMVKYSCPNT